MAGDGQMKPLAEQVFIGEIVMQSKIAARAAERLQATNNNFDWIEVWCSIQSILAAAGNVSKILWLQKKKYAARGEALRKMLDVDDSNPLYNRNFRNHFEHYDERIEIWFEENRSAVYVDSVVDPFEPIWGNKFPNRHRAYDPLTKILTFRGESVDLAELLKALDQIRQKCRPFALQ